MKNGIVYFPESKNIGDDIQTYAASLFVNNPVLCDREKLNQITNPTNLLCNGWFMHTKNWPPSKSVNPLFLSFHISTHDNANLTGMTQMDSISYFKRNEPIGCRDYGTMEILSKLGIKTYFSGCLTLTLPKISKPKTDEILAVDVLRSNYSKNYRKTIVEHLIPAEMKGRIQHITHLSDSLRSQSSNIRLENAKQLVERYGRAKLVITSLIHCALPCVAMGTPVVFIDFGFNNGNAKRDRFKGITDMFNIYSNIEMPFMERNLSSKIARFMGLYNLYKTQMKPLPIELFNSSKVYDKHLPLAVNMKATVTNFFDS